MTEHHLLHLELCTFLTLENHFWRMLFWLLFPSWSIGLPQIGKFGVITDFESCHLELALVGVVDIAVYFRSQMKLTVVVSLCFYKIELCHYVRHGSLYPCHCEPISKFFLELIIFLPH